jgi:hypothetical protein
VEKNKTIFELKIDGKNINVLIMDEVKKELRLQGHYATGELEDSMKGYDAELKNENLLQAYALMYIQELEFGVPAAKIKLSESEFQNLRKWTKVKGLATNEAEATQIAAAIVRTWKREGKPSPGSREFSQTGDVLGAIKTTFDKNEELFSDLILDEVADEVDKRFSQLKSETI